MLHVLNGESLRRPFTLAGVPGAVAVWPEILMEGPAPASAGDEAAWSARAQALAAALDLSPDEHRARLADLRALFARLPNEDEVVLWFEEDLFCQVHLAFLLASADLPASASVVCPRRALGDHDPNALASLFMARERAAARRDVARRFWDAYAAPDPRALLDLLAPDAAWPALSEGVLAHLRRFPSVENGLAAEEEAALRAIEGGALEFRDVFTRATRDPRVKPLGLSDTQLLARLERLASAPQPLLDLSEAGGSAPRGGLTAFGRAVLRGEEDHARANGIDRFLGGVRLAGRACWRWDEGAQLLRAP